MKMSSAGQVLCKPKSVTPHTHFEAEAYILTKEEGGRHTPVLRELSPAILLPRRTRNVTGNGPAARRHGKW